MFMSPWALHAPMAVVENCDEYFNIFTCLPTTSLSFAFAVVTRHIGLPALP